MTILPRVGSLEDGNKKVEISGKQDWNNTKSMILVKYRLQKLCLKHFTLKFCFRILIYTCQKGFKHNLKIYSYLLAHSFSVLYLLM